MRLLAAASKAQLRGGVVQRVKKKMCLDHLLRAEHTQQELSHLDNKGGLGSRAVSSSTLPRYPSITFALEIMIFFGPLLGLLCNTEGSR